MNEMTIGQLAKAAGVGVETVRYYQRSNLLDTPAARADDALGRKTRRYGETHLRTLRFIRSAQAAGFTLKEIAELIRLDAGTDRARAHAMAEERIRDLDTRIATLQASRDALQRLASDCAGGGTGPCPILAAFEPPGASARN